MKKLLRLDTASCQDQMAADQAQAPFCGFGRLRAQKWLTFQASRPKQDVLRQHHCIQTHSQGGSQLTLARRTLGQLHTDVEPDNAAELCGPATWITQSSTPRACSDCMTPYLKARRVATPLMASPMEVYTGDREMESRRLTSLTLACIIKKDVNPDVHPVTCILISSACLK